MVSISMILNEQKNSEKATSLVGRKSEIHYLR